MKTTVNKLQVRTQEFLISFQVHNFWFEQTARECQKDKESLYDQDIQKKREVVTFTNEEQRDMLKNSENKQTSFWQLKLS